MSVDLETVRDYLEWQHAIHGGASTESEHVDLVRRGRPMPTLDEALGASLRLVDAADSSVEDVRRAITNEAWAIGDRFGLTREQRAILATRMMLAAEFPERRTDP